MSSKFRTVSKAKLQELYHDEGMRLIDIANKYGVCESYVSKKFRLFGIKTKRGPDKKHVPRELVERLYVEEEMGLREIAERCEVSTSTIHKRLLEWGIETRPTKVYEPLDKEELKRLYYDEELSLEGVAEELGCSMSKVHKDMKKLGLPRREAQKFQPKEEWGPCCECGTMGGPANEATGNPYRISGARFGIDGKLCKTCYCRHYYHQTKG